MTLHWQFYLFGTSPVLTFIVRVCLRIPCHTPTRSLEASAHIHRNVNNKPSYIAMAYSLILCVFTSATQFRKTDFSHKRVANLNKIEMHASVPISYIA